MIFEIKSVSSVQFPMLSLIKLDVSAHFSVLFLFYVKSRSTYLDQFKISVQKLKMNYRKSNFSKSSQTVSMTLSYNVTCKDSMNWPWSPYPCHMWPTVNLTTTRKIIVCKDDLLFDFTRLIVTLLNQFLF